MDLPFSTPNLFALKVTMMVVIVWIHLSTSPFAVDSMILAASSSNWFSVLASRGPLDTTLLNGYPWCLTRIGSCACLRKVRKSSKVRINNLNLWTRISFLEVQTLHTYKQHVNNKSEHTQDLRSHRAVCIFRWSGPLVALRITNSIRVQNRVLPHSFRKKKSDFNEPFKMFCSCYSLQTK